MPPKCQKRRDGVYAMRILTVLAMIAGVSSCAGSQGPTSSSFAVTFTTESDLGLPLGGVIVSANNAGVGSSDSDGVVQTMLRGPDGAAVQITYECPEGHRQPESAKVLRLHRFQSLDPTAQAGLHMLLTCRRFSERSPSWSERANPRFRSYSTTRSPPPPTRRELRTSSDKQIPAVTFSPEAGHDRQHANPPAGAASRVRVR